MLCDCRHFAPSELRFFSTGLQLFEVVKQQQPESLSKYATIVLDQIYNEKGLVYNKKALSMLVAFLTVRSLDSIDTNKQNA